MPNLAYVGPKVEVSQHGVVYRKDKEDKYIYLSVALEILKDIDNDYEKKAAYCHHFKTLAFSEDELLETLRYYEEEFDKHIDEESKAFQEKIAHEVDFVKSLKNLSEDEKEVWIKNIELMREYRIKREVNKMYYLHCVEDIAKVVRGKNIKEICVPLNRDFFHVLNTLKGTLITGKPSLDATISEGYNDEGAMSLTLRIK